METEAHKYGAMSLGWTSRRVSIILDGQEQVRASRAKRLLLPLHHFITPLQFSSKSVQIQLNIFGNQFLHFSWLGKHLRLWLMQTEFPVLPLALDLLHYCLIWLLLFAGVIWVQVFHELLACQAPDCCVWVIRHCTGLAKEI